MKKGIKYKIRQVLFRNHIWIEQINSKNELKRFLKRFSDKFISCDLIRVGGENDGGYLIPNNLNEISFCFSPGVSDRAYFEKDLSDNYNIKSFMADASVKASPIKDMNFEFIPKFLGSYSNDKFITLSDWIESTIGKDQSGKILQMDIEGGEYDVLTYEDSGTLASFSILVIEFHFLQKLFEKDFLKMFSSIFEKIFRNFSICHVHPNNCCGIANLDGISVPRIMEVTFIRNDLIEKFLNKYDINLPHRLDRKNSLKNKDIIMPEIWWKKN